MPKPRTPQRPAGAGGPGHKAGGRPDSLAETDAEIVRLLERRSRALAAKEAKGVDPVTLERESWQRWREALGPRRGLAAWRAAFEAAQTLPAQAKRPETLADFRLDPPQKAVAVDLPGPVDENGLILFLCLASLAGAESHFPGHTPAEATGFAIRALNALGAAVYADEAGLHTRSREGGLRSKGRTLHCGASPLVLGLLLGLGLSEPGQMKLVGDTAGMGGDLAPFANALPGLKARLTSLAPGAKGLPARLESAGELPERAALPAGTPVELAYGLVLAALRMGQPLTLDLPKDLGPDPDMLAVFRQAGAELIFEDGSLRLGAGPLAPPAEPRLPMAALPALFWLALPACRAGGQSRLLGKAPDGPLWEEGLALLAAHGLAVDVAEAEAVSRPRQASETTPAAFRPVPGLYALDTALRLARGGAPDLDAAPSTRALWAASELAEAVRGASRQAYYAPDAAWSLAAALAAMKAPFLLANPETLAELAPGFWNLYNGLPTPSPSRERTPEEPPDDDGPKRRRIIAP